MNLKLILLAGAALAANPVLAQTNSVAEKTADDLICELSGDCEPTLAATRDAPETRGFKIAKKTSAAEPQVAKPKLVESHRAPVASAPGRKALPPTKPSYGRADLRVTFVTGSTELTSEGKKSADAFVTALVSPSLSGKKFRIEGHTDAVGSRSFNMDLSNRRAQAVVDYLASKGVDRSRFSVAGYGFDKPVSSENSANRRVEIVVVK